MTLNAFYAWCIWALYMPFMVVVLILVHYWLRRILWRSRKRRGKGRLGFYPSAFALGLAFQFIQVYHRPSMAYVVEAKLKEDADEDDNGDPDSPVARLRHFHRQLRRIRRGEWVDRLVLRM